ncbi:hypothetical protein EDD92_0702 [Streptomyces sp. TLI_185]|nr:hypothetical protein EDD92_0702 [Streptomyces sp. TLI_185]
MRSPLNGLDEFRSGSTAPQRGAGPYPFAAPPGGTSIWPCCAPSSRPKALPAGSTSRRPSTAASPTAACPATGTSTAATSPTCTPEPLPGHRVAALPYPHVGHPYRHGGPPDGRRTRYDRPRSTFRCPAVEPGSAAGRTAVVDKTVALHTSRDPAIGDPLFAAVDRVTRAPGLELMQSLPEPRRREPVERTGLDGGELEQWEDGSRTLQVPFHEGVISRFGGYRDLAELDWDDAGLSLRTGRTAGLFRRLGAAARRGHVAGAWPGPGGRRRGSSAWKPSWATSPRSRAAPPVRGSTWAPWPAPSTSCSAD